MPGWLFNSFKWAAWIGTAALAGCSIHPIPDDVSRYDTAEIVKNIRCEAKSAVRERIRQALHERGIYDIIPDTVLDPKVFAKLRRRDRILAEKFKAYGASTITYEFKFDITESNTNAGGATFKLPFTNGGNFSLLLDGQFDKTRQGIRTFTTVETFAELAQLKCENWTQPRRNMLYPLTGSVGVGRIVTTFINISELGSQDVANAASPEEKVFTDVLTFTTTVIGSVNPVLQLDPLPDRFRPMDAHIQSIHTRKDMHQVTITLLFPNLEALRNAVSTGRENVLARSNEAKALENNCVAVERAREDRFQMLRRRPPAIYCRPDDTGVTSAADDGR